MEDSKERAGRRTICELMMGILMLLLVAGMNLYTDEYPFLLKQAFGENVSVRTRNFTGADNFAGAN
ncbi:MAG: hypothetical protein Q4F21_00295, partial [Lachnospiraceae bacterium]|nr:hypothetical protein [Lachnospiraceae bacterium]